MSDAQKAELTVALTIAIAGTVALLYGLWKAYWGIFDHFMQKHKRRKNAQFDARVGRDCYGDVKGLTK